MKEQELEKAARYVLNCIWRGDALGRNSECVKQLVQAMQSTTTTVVNPPLTDEELAVLARGENVFRNCQVDLRTHEGRVKALQDVKD